ncbi:hypothetical protein K488DRAFT_74727 [Vararia minispora EC-137]|uniref:Uncharacterized protein n=1 Tax=Vararia minispora EC-137 TaxID=1314806 RepID=A0ACB8Q624_9AGAM|nr:hypothetical protein K488DRAFT_74727 [Vararia minispora EC-137]
MRDAPRLFGARWREKHVCMSKGVQMNEHWPANVAGKSEEIVGGGVAGGDKFFEEKPVREAQSHTCRSRQARNIAEKIPGTSLDRGWMPHARNAHLALAPSLCPSFPFRPTPIPSDPRTISFVTTPRGRTHKAIAFSAPADLQVAASVPTHHAHQPWAPLPGHQPHVRSVHLAVEKAYGYTPWECYTGCDHHVEAIKVVLSHNELLVTITLQSNIQVRRYLQHMPLLSVSAYLSLLRLRAIVANGKRVNNILTITLQSSPSPSRPPAHATALGRASTTSVSRSLWSGVQVHQNLPHMPLLSVTAPRSLHRLHTLVANDERIDPEVREIRWVTNSRHSMVRFHLSTDLDRSLTGVPAVGNLTLFERQNHAIPNRSVHYDNRSE